MCYSIGVASWVGESIEKGSEFPQKVSSDTWRVYLIIHSLIMWNNLMHISDFCFHYFIFIGVYCVIVVCILFVDRQDPTTLWKQVSVTLWTHRFFSTGKSPQYSSSVQPERDTHKTTNSRRSPLLFQTGMKPTSYVLLLPLKHQWNSTQFEQIKWWLRILLSSDLWGEVVVWSVII